MDERSERAEREKDRDKEKSTSSRGAKLEGMVLQSYIENELHHYQPHHTLHTHKKRLPTDV